MDSPLAAQPDKRLSWRASVTSTEIADDPTRNTSPASVNDPTRNIDDVRRRSSFVNVLKSSLEKLAAMEGDFNHLWIQEFRELYFNPLPLKRLCYVMCLGSAAMLVSDYFGKIAEKGYHERLGIAEQEGEHFWQLMSSIGYATPGAAGVISLILLSTPCLRGFFNSQRIVF